MCERVGGQGLTNGWKSGWMYGLAVLNRHNKIYQALDNSKITYTNRPIHVPVESLLTLAPIIAGLSHDYHTGTLLFWLL